MLLLEPDPTQELLHGVHCTVGGVGLQLEVPDGRGRDSGRRQERIRMAMIPILVFNLV